MRLGLQVPSFSWADGTPAIAKTLSRIAINAESSGIYSFWVMDHFFQIPNVGKPEEPMLEGWSALAFVAGKTKTIRLGTMVTGAIYRHPGILVKTATTLDVLSGGRAYLGIGAAWNEEESTGLGIPFPPLAERFERLEETLQIVHQMWAGNESAFHGKHFDLERLLNSPQPVQRPHPPILIGGSGEKKTLKLVAQYADACNLFAFDHSIVRHKLQVLRDHCEALGRDYDAIEKTSLSRVHLNKDGSNGATSPAQLLEQFGQLAELGIDHAIFNMTDVASDEPFELLAEQVIPHLPQR